MTATAASSEPTSYEIEWLYQGYRSISRTDVSILHVPQTLTWCWLEAKVEPEFFQMFTNFEGCHFVDIEIIHKLNWTGNSGQDRIFLFKTHVVEKECWENVHRIYPISSGFLTRDHIYTGVHFLNRIGPFSNFLFQEIIMNKWPHVAYRKKTPILLLLQFAQNCKSISLELRPQEEVKNGSSLKNTL